MNKWLTLVIVFVVGIVVGSAAMYAAGVRPQLGRDSKVISVPDVAGISGVGLGILKDNPLVKSAEVRVVLRGLVESGDSTKDNVILLVSDGGAAIPIQVKLTDKTTGPDVVEGDRIEVQGTLLGRTVIADSVTKI